MSDLSCSFPYSHTIHVYTIIIRLYMVPKPRLWNDTSRQPCIVWAYHHRAGRGTMEQVASNKSAVWHYQRGGDM